MYYSIQMVSDTETSLARVFYVSTFASMCICFCATDTCVFDGVLVFLAVWVFVCEFVRQVEALHK